MLNLEVVKGYSQYNVYDIVSDKIKGQVDFAFIDGKHTNEQQILDFNAVSQVASNDCIYTFHDVINWEMVDSFMKIKEKSDLSGKVLFRTTSGMGIVYPKNGYTDIEQCIDAFSENENFIKAHFNYHGIKGDVFY